MTEKRIEEKTLGELEEKNQNPGSVFNSFSNSVSPSKTNIDYSFVLKERAWYERFSDHFRGKELRQSRNLAYITQTLTARLYGSAEEQGLLPKLKSTLEQQHRCALELTLVQSYVKAIGEVQIGQLSSDPLVLAYLNTAHQIRYKQLETEKDDLTARLESYNARAGEYLQKIEAAEPLLAAAKKESHGLAGNSCVQKDSSSKK